MLFGEIISEARKRRGMSQKELAARLKKEDGSHISPQYLNDLEHDRRHPPSEHLLKQIATNLDLSFEYLLYLAGEFPMDLRNLRSSPEDFEKAISAFRKALKGKP